jgi:hypothetical protein
MNDNGDIAEVLAAIASEEEAAAGQQKGPRVRSGKPPREPSQVYSIRVPVERLEEVRRLAEIRGLAPTVMLRTWILERLDVEAGGAGAMSIRVVRHPDGNVTPLRRQSRKAANMTPAASSIAIGVRRERFASHGA